MNKKKSGQKRIGIEDWGMGVALSEELIEKLEAANIGAREISFLPLSDLAPGDNIRLQAHNGEMFYLQVVSRCWDLNPDENKLVLSIVEIALSSSELDPFEIH